MNSLDPEVAEQPKDMIVSRRLGKPIADWASFEATAALLRALAPNETLLVQSGKPAGPIRTRDDAPRVVIVDADPAASWTYIGPQGFLPGAYEILASAGRAHFSAGLAGKLIVSTAMEDAGSAIPLAGAMNGAAALGIDGDAERIKRCVKGGYCDVMVNDLDEALRILKNAVRKREPASVGLIGDSARVIAEMAGRGVVPDLLAETTEANESSRDYVEGRRALQTLGSIVIDLGEPAPGDAGLPARWIALSGEPTDISRIDRLLLELFPDNEGLVRWIKTLQRRIRYQGLPARACSLAVSQLREFSLAVNELVARAEVKAPIVMAVDNIHAAERFTPADKTESSHKSSVAPIDSHELESLIELANGATWASFQSAPGKGAALVISRAIVVDGSSEASARLERFWSKNSLDFKR